ncbi:MAG: hypothetical protein AB7H96_12855 [Vicinamibacterales bacterium]
MTLRQVANTRVDDGVLLHVSGTEWAFRVRSVSRVGRDLFVQVDLRGPEDCSVTVHIRDGIVLGLTAEAILYASCEWLRSRGTARHGYLDLAEWQAACRAADVA